MKWRAKGTTNSVPVVTMIPRITMIAGLDTQGRVYVSLVQGNSNDQTMDIFFRHLCMKLDRERPNWRYNTVVLLDNAPYHTSTATMRILNFLEIPVCFTGAHSYSAAPCELLFAAFKSRDINPSRVAIGKSQFR
jgi:hypothetical protein